MTHPKRILAGAIAVLGLSASVSAFAGPPVTIKVKNLNTTTAAVKVTTSTNEITTQANASPTPEATIDFLSENNFVVQSTISPSVNYAALRYRVGSKECTFYTAFTVTYSNGVALPQWSKSATPSGGAVCTATITSTNITTYNWAVTFTIK